MLKSWRDPDEWSSPGRSYQPNQFWVDICGIITREKGVFKLCEHSKDPFSDCQHYVLTASTADALDLIELSFRYIDRVVRVIPPHRRELYGFVDPDEAIAELNGRFREHGIGYEYANGEIIRVDSKYLHVEAVKPALELLHDSGKKFAWPLQEFLTAPSRRSAAQSLPSTMALVSWSQLGKPTPPASVSLTQAVALFCSPTSVAGLATTSPPPTGSWATGPRKTST
jgi:hypothetical protein